MTVSYGFYNGVDRKYAAKAFSEIFNGIINDGVFQSYGKALIVKAAHDMTVQIQPGRAWFNGTWTDVDVLEDINIPEADLIYDRIDALVLEINENTRVNSFKVISGTPQTNPVKPTLERKMYLNQYALAYISVKKGVKKIGQADIRNAVGTPETPFVTGILKTISLDELLGQWQAQLDDFVKDNTTMMSKWFEDKKIEFDNWMALQKESFNNWTTTTKSEYESWIAEQKQIFETWANNNRVMYDSWIQENESLFLAWFNKMKGQLSTDSAGKIQLDLDDKYNTAMGYSGLTTVFNPDGSITTTHDNGDVEKTVFNTDGSISETITSKGVVTEYKTIFENTSIRRSKIKGV